MGDEFTLISLIGTIIIAGAITAIVLVIVSYVFFAIGLYAMAKKRRQARRAFWAWIPFLRLYLLGLLARDTGMKMGTKAHWNVHVLLPVARVAEGVLILVSVNMQSAVLFFLSVLAFSVLYLFCLYGLLKGYDWNKRAGMHISLSAFIPLYSSILVYAFRNRPFLFGGEEREGARDVSTQ